MIRIPQEALRMAVDDLGGEQRAGHLLRPELDPILAGQWLSHCLSLHERHKLSLEQLVLLLLTARKDGKHRAFEALAELCGYRVTAVVTDAEVIADLARKAEKAAREAGELTDEIRARMRAAHLGID